VASIEVEGDGHCCALCGLDLPNGTPANPAARRVDSATFNNRRDLASKMSPYICGDCEASWGDTYRNPPYSCSISTKDGLFPIFSRQDISWFLVNPPEPPFMMQFSNARMQPMIWRGMVTFDRNFIQIRIGEVPMTIRRPVLLKAYERNRLVTEAYAEWEHARRLEEHEEARRQLLQKAIEKADAKAARSGKKRGEVSVKEGKIPERLDPYRHVFKSLEYNMKATEPQALSHGIMMPRFEEFLRETGRTDDLELLNSLSVGEYWALGALLKQPLDSLTHPPSADRWIVLNEAKKAAKAAAAEGEVA